MLPSRLTPVKCSSVESLHRPATTTGPIRRLPETTVQEVEVCMTQVRAAAAVVGMFLTVAHPTLPPEVPVEALEEVAEAA